MWTSAFELRGNVVGRAPAAPVAVAAVVGIVADWSLEPSLSAWWWLLSGVALLGAILRQREPRGAAIALIVGLVAAFGAWHHLARNTISPEAESFLAQRTSRPVQVDARVVRPTWTQERPDDHAVATFGVLDDVHLVDGHGRRDPFSARVRLVIENAVRDLPAGARVRAVGRLSAPSTAGNPGGFDFREWLHRQGVAAVLRVDTVEAIHTIEFAPSFLDRLQNQRRELRNRAVAVLQRSVAPETAVVAEALLLGSRQQMPEELRQAFLESGTLHVLAISGVNVGVIWLGLVRGCRSLGWSMRQTGWTVIGGLLLYAWLTDANPPIVRAVTVAIVFQGAELFGRQVSSLQGLSLALLAVLIGNPQDLFHPGAQLSFLSVSALSTVQQWWDGWIAAADDAVEPDTAVARWSRRLGLAFLQANLSTGAVWAVTLPLVAWRFHLVSFAGFFLNVLMGPLVCVLLWSGYLWLVCAALMPTVGEVPLRAFEATLVLLIWITERAADWQCSHLYVAGPPDWWVLGFYLALAFGGLVVPRSRWRWIGHGLLNWANFGLAWTLLAPTSAPGLVCEVLSVGHGLAVVTHCPNGRTLVYDAGSLIGPAVATEAVCGSLWRTGQRHVDALVVSHADVDHCNGVPLVADRSSPGTLLAHRTFLDFRQPAVANAVDAWTSRGGRCRLIAAGDRIAIDPHVTVDVWHPAAGFADAKDNPNSLVICIAYAGRRILLTGDLEREGLAALLTRPRRPVDVLLAPHHGARGANPPALGAWTHPAWVAISAADRQVEERLAASFEPPATLLNTANRGMIRIEIRPDGELIVTTFR